MVWFSFGADTSFVRTWVPLSMLRDDFTDYGLIWLDGWMYTYTSMNDGEWVYFLGVSSGVYT